MFKLKRQNKIKEELSLPSRFIAAAVHETMNNRKDRINAEMQRVISKIISTELKDPRIVSMVSVTNCEVTTDLKHAKVFLSIYDESDENRDKTFKAIENCKNFIRHLLKSEIDLRIIPDLHFEIDDSLVHSMRINKILKELEKDEK